MRRRDFITLVGGAATAAPSTLWPLPARAQQVRRIGALMVLAKADPEDATRIAAFEDGLRQAGWIEGRNIHIEYRWYAGEAARAQTLAKELLELRPEAIMVGGSPGALALRQETRTVPIVFVTVSDPIGLGLVDNLARPGGNATGFTFFEFSVGGKLLEVLKQAVPSVVRVAACYNPESGAFTPFLNSIQSAASALGVELVPAPTRNPAEIEAAIVAIARAPGGGLICLPDAYLNAQRELIITLAARHRLPAIYTVRFFATDGGLLSYGIDTPDLYRRAAGHVDRILKGANPAELPVQQPSKYELVLNLKTAKALGLTIPLTLQVTADEVIE